jgi:hypothetical protein
MTSPTARTKKLLEAAGWEIAIVERYNSFVRRRFDLFEFADLLAIAYPNPPVNIVAIQVTSGSHHAHRLGKILANPKALRFLRAGGSIWVISWRKRKPIPGSRQLWIPRTEIITEDMFSIPEHQTEDEESGISR